MKKRDDWAVVAGALDAARDVGMLSVCTCGAPGWGDGKCGYCRLEEAEKALHRLMIEHLAQVRMVEVLWELGRGGAVGGRYRDRRRAAEEKGGREEGLVEAIAGVVEELGEEWPDAGRGGGRGWTRGVGRGGSRGRSGTEERMPAACARARTRGPSRSGAMYAAVS